MGVAPLYVVAEHVVVAYLQARNARALALALLQAQQVVLARVRNLAQFVQLLIDTAVYHVAAVHHIGRVGVNLPAYALAHQCAGVQSLAYAAQNLVLRP